DVAILVGQTVTVRGRVVMPDGSAATNTVVVIDSRGVAVDQDGRFAIPGVPVRPGTAQAVIARSRDGLRTGHSTVTINDASPTMPDVLIALSGVGSVNFLVVDPLGTPIAGQIVALISPCSSACGCATRIRLTGLDGRVQFNELAVGSITATAVRLVGQFGD